MSNMFEVQLLTEEEVSDNPVEVKEETPVETKQDDNPIEEVADKPKIDLLEEDEVEVPVNETPETPKGKKEEKKEPETFTPDADYFKALAQYNIDNGLWEKYDNWEEEKDKVEWNQELFLEIQEQQIQTKIQKAIEEEKDSYGSQYKQVLEYAKNGGNIENLYGSFQQEASIESLDPSDVSDAETILKEYGDSVGWDKEDIKDYIETCKDKGEEVFKTIAAKRKTQLVEAIQEEREVEIEKAKAYDAQRKAYVENFNKQLRTVIHKKDIPEREKKELEKFIFEYKYQNENGQKFTEYDKISSEIRNNPEKFVQFAEFLRNPDKFGNKKTVEKETKKEVFKFIRSNQSELGKNTSQAPQLQKGGKTKGQYNPFITS